MASDKINPDDLNISVDELNRLTSLLGGTVTNESTVDQAWIKLIKAIKARKEASQNLKDAAISATRDLIGVADNLSKTDRVTLETTNSVLGMVSSFSSLLDTIPYVGKLLSAGVNALTEVEKFQITQLSDAYTHFEKLSDYGILHTFEDLRNISATTGLSFDDINKVFTKNSETLAKFGKSVVDGTKNFSALVNDSKEISFDFQRIGLSAGEVADMQLRYIERQAKFGKLKDLTDAKNIQGTKDYILLVDQLTKITGKSREEIQKELDEQAKDVQAVVGLRGLEDSAQKEITTLLETLRAVDPEMAKGFGQAIYSNANQVTDYTLYIMNTLGKAGYNYQDTIRGLRAGKINAQEFSDIWAKASKRIADDPQVKIVSAVRGDTEKVTRGLRGSLLYANKAGMKLEDIRAEVLAAQTAALDGVDKNSKNISDSVRRMYDVGVQMKLFATGSTSATNQLQYLSKTAQTTSEALYNIVRDKNSLPVSITARKERALQAYEQQQYERELSISKQVQAGARGEADTEREATFGNAALRRRNNAAKRTIETQNKNLVDYSKKRDEANVATARLDKQIAAINQQEADVKYAEDLNKKYGVTETEPKKTEQPSKGGTGVPSGVSAPPSDSGVVSPKTSASISGTAKAAYNYFISQGWTPGQAAGIVGNLLAENSQFKPDLQGDSGQAIGLAQWHSARQRDFERVFQKPIAQSTFEDQLAFINWELNNTERQAGQLLRSAKTTADAAVIIDRFYERSAGSDRMIHQGRVSNAEQVLKAAALDSQQSTDSNATTPQNKLGGMLSGPSTGYLVELHGDEIVIPANPGSQLTQLQQALGGTDRQDREAMTKLFSMISDSLDSLISVERTNKSTHEKEIIYSM